MVKKEKIAIGRLDGMRNDLLHANKKIRIGFVGGGPNSFIGYTHRLAARFDNRFEFVAGVFSKNIKKSEGNLLIKCAKINIYLSGLSS